MLRWMRAPLQTPNTTPNTAPNTAISCVSALRGGGESPLGFAGAPLKCASVGRVAPGSLTHGGTWAKFGFKYGTCSWQLEGEAFPPAPCT